MSDEQAKDLMSQELLDKFRYFLQDHFPERMNRNLRKVFFDYMRQQHAGLDVDFDTILDDMEALMDFLDICSDEKKIGRTSSKTLRKNAQRVMLYFLYVPPSLLILLPGFF